MTIYYPFKPIKGESFRLYFAVRCETKPSVFNNPYIVDTLTWGSMAFRISKDGGVGASCTNAPVSIEKNYGYVELTATEMNADVIIFHGYYYENLGNYYFGKEVTVIVHTTTSTSSGITAADVWNHPAASITTSGSIGESTLAINTTLTGAQTELSSIPTPTSSLVNKISGIFQYLFNKKVITDTSEKTYKTDDSTVLGTSTIVDDGITFSKGRIQ